MCHSLQLLIKGPKLNKSNIQSFQQLFNGSRIMEYKHNSINGPNQLHNLCSNFLSLQISTAAEPQTMLIENGFEIIHQYDMDGNKFNADKSLNFQETFSLVHAIDEDGFNFYKNFGLESSPIRNNQLVLLLKDAKK